MCSDIINRCGSPEARRAIFLNEKLCDGHQLERCIDGLWSCVEVVDSIDVLLNPADYRVRMQRIQGRADRPTHSLADKPDIKVVEPSVIDERANINYLIDRLSRPRRIGL